MDQKIHGQWIAALESGQYQQGKRVLRTSDDTYCCLGVLCDLAVKADLAKWENISGDWVIMPKNETFETAYGADTATGLLPRFVREWAKLDTENPFVETSTSSGRVCLSQLNDTYDYSFAQIADAIKESL